MSNSTEALLSVAPHMPSEPRVAAARVLAIVRLRRSRRAWFVTGVQRQGPEVEVIGYAPGCMHASGDWFSLEPTFFELAAEASGDALDVELIENPVPLNVLEDESL